MYPLKLWQNNFRIEKNSRRIEDGMKSCYEELEKYFFIFKILYNIKS